MAQRLEAILSNNFWRNFCINHSVPLHQVVTTLPSGSVTEYEQDACSQLAELA